MRMKMLVAMSAVGEEGKGGLVQAMHLPRILLFVEIILYQIPRVTVCWMIAQVDSSLMQGEIDIFLLFHCVPARVHQRCLHGCATYGLIREQPAFFDFVKKERDIRKQLAQMSALACVDMLTCDVLCRSQ